jgi:hypothetical protein
VGIVATRDWRDGYIKGLISKNRGSPESWIAVVVSGLTEPLR